MSDGSKIEWLCAPGYRPATWNPTRGCSRVSKGCENCYAERVAHRFSGPGMPYERLVDAKGRWTGQVKIVYKKLGDPMRWRDPRMVFVDSMSDLFHEAVPDEWIDQVFAAMALCPQHRFLVLTKRPARMRRYACDADTPRRVARAMAAINGKQWAGLAWPLSNVWKGCSVENQATADERIPLLLDTPAAVRWISAEPMIGPIDLTYLKDPRERERHDALTGWSGYDNAGDTYEREGGPRLDQIIAGGESGPGARPSHTDWFRSLRDQCRAAGVSFFMKQITEHGKKIPFESFPADLQIREYPVGD